MKLIQAVRRLYKPKGKRLPLPMIVELNRRLVKGYQRYKDDPRIVDLKKSVLGYNKQLMMLNVRDHQLEYAKFSVPKVVFTLIYRLTKLVLLTTFVLPGLILFAPIFIAGKLISIKKSREALAASTVKIQARDVMATWKLLVSLALAPTLYTIYTVTLTYWTHCNRVQGYMPDWVPLWMVVIFGYIFFPTITFAALRFGEIGMDIFKSMRPLVLSLNPSSGNTFVKLRKRRSALVAQVTEVINTLGPEMFPDFDSHRIIPATEQQDGTPSNPATPADDERGHSAENNRVNLMNGQPPSPGTDPLSPVASHQALMRNESFKDLANAGFFATRPSTPKKSRSRTNSGSWTPCVAADCPRTQLAR